MKNPPLQSNIYIPFPVCYIKNEVILYGFFKSQIQSAQSYAYCDLKIQNLPFGIYDVAGFQKLQTYIQENIPE